jgi:hypothetical protein
MKQSLSARIARVFTGEILAIIVMIDDELVIFVSHSEDIHLLSRGFSSVEKKYAKTKRPPPKLVAASPLKRTALHI